MKYLILLLALTGCASGAVYSQSNLANPPKGESQIVIYHPKEMAHSLAFTDVKINGVSSGNLPNGGYLVALSDTPHTNISSTEALSPGTSAINLKTQPNKRYYVRITWDMDKVWAGAAVGAIGSGIAESVSSSHGPFVIESVDQATAEAELSGLKMVN